MSNQRSLRKLAGAAGGVSPDLDLALAPEATYDRLVHARTAGSLRALAGRLLLAVAMIGTCVSASATGRVSVELAAGVALSWSFALLVQAVAAAVVIVPARGRIVTPLRAFELWFQAHLPWSLWFLLPPLYIVVAGRRPADGVALAAALVPMAWTALLMRAFARRVLRSPRAGIVTVVHQTVLWGLTLCYIAFALGGWDRVLAEAGL
jgi:hypothetical protein